MNKKNNTLILVFVGLFLFSCGSQKKKNKTSFFQEEPAEIIASDSVCFIQNDYVKLGIDMTAGGSLFFFGEKTTGRNLLNHCDKGRFIQQSYYGVKDGSDWNGKPWQWNPIQGGGWKSHVDGTAPIILEKDFSSNHLYVKSHPMHWASGEHLKEVIYEEMITLNKNIAHIHFSFTYNGTITHPLKSQEVPAVFVDAALPNLAFYNGNQPWTGDSLEFVVPGWPNQPRNTTEHWAAYVDNNHWGIGVYTPGTNQMTTYRFKGNGTQGPKGSACSYFAPVRNFAVTPGKKFEYDVYLNIGNVDTIREQFKEIYLRSEKTLHHEQ